MLFKGDGVEINKSEAIKYYKMAIDKGNIFAMNNYAIILFTGDGIETNKQEAFKYYKMDADNGNVAAMKNYANKLSNGEGIEINKHEAFKYYKMAAEKSDIYFCVRNIVTITIPSFVIKIKGHSINVHAIKKLNLIWIHNLK